MKQNLATQNQLARASILKRIENNLENRTNAHARYGQFHEHLLKQETGPIPNFDQVEQKALIELFCEQLTKVGGHSIETNDFDTIPALLAKLMGNNAQKRSVMLTDDCPAQTTNLLTLNWTQQNITPISWNSQTDCHFAINHAIAGIAETGTLLMHSGKNRPTGLNFLSSHHVSVLKYSHIVATMEIAWSRLRTHYHDGLIPRSINLITGPSRTGDIEQTIEIGAHGPLEMTVIIYYDG